MIYETEAMSLSSVTGNPQTTPIHDEDGHLIFLLHHVEDVTDQVLAFLSGKQDGSDRPHSLDATSADDRRE